MTLPVRYSPSGPIIGGAGQTLRMSENADQMTTQGIGTTQTVISFQGSLDGIASLTLPKVDLNYAVEARLSVNNTNASVTNVLTMRLQLSYDQSTWFNQQDVQYVFKGGANRTVIAAFPLALGSALATPMPAGSAQIAARLQLASDIASDLDVVADELDTYFLRLSELAA